MSIGVALVVSTDVPALQQLSAVLQELSISPDVCREPAAALRLLNCRKFDAVIIDLQMGEQARIVLEEARLSPSNRTAVTFIVSSVDGKVDQVVWKRADFVFNRPLSTSSVRKTLKPAYGLILRERRRYFRYPITMPVVITRKDLPEVHCQSLNISEGGMALSTFVPLHPGEKVQVRFTVADRNITCIADSIVCWHKTGHLGVRFVRLADDQKDALQNWLSENLEHLLPEFVTKMFSQASTLVDVSRDS